jgi:hypothetical protein
MREILAMLELASGSLVPRPTVTSRLSLKSLGRSPGVTEAMRSAAALISLASTPRSRPSRASTPGLSATKLFISHGKSFLTWLAANSIPGTA